MKSLFFALALIVFAPLAQAYDCDDYSNWNLQQRISAIDSRLKYYRFNQFYYQNVPTGWLTVQYDIEKYCNIADNKSKNLDDAIEEMCIKNGMKK